MLSISLLLAIIGAVNWGLVGLLGIDLVATLFGFSPPLIRAVYIIVGAAGLYLAYAAKKLVTTFG